MVKSDLETETVGAMRRLFRTTEMQGGTLYFSRPVIDEDDEEAKLATVKGDGGTRGVNGIRPSVRELSS